MALTLEASLTARVTALIDGGTRRVWGSQEHPEQAGRRWPMRWWRRREDVRLARLVARHERSGKLPGAAHDGAHGPDQRNAELVAATRERSDVVVQAA